MLTSKHNNRFTRTITRHFGEGQFDSKGSSWFVGLIGFPLSYQQSCKGSTKRVEIDDEFISKVKDIAIGAWTVVAIFPFRGQPILVCPPTANIKSMRIVK